MIEFFSNIINGIKEVLNFFKTLFEIITISIDFIPSPFKEITLIFLPIIIASIIYKIRKGG